MKNNLIYIGICICVAIIITTTKFNFKKRNENLLELQNIEALASGEDNQICYGDGEVICPYTGLGVEYVWKRSK